VVLAILRAESLSEVPVIGRMIAASDRRAHATDGVGANGEAESGASLLPSPDRIVPDPLVEEAPGTGSATARESAVETPAGRPRR
jgi:hypothetical protein